MKLEYLSLSNTNVKNKTIKNDHGLQLKPESVQREHTLVGLLSNCLPKDTIKCKHTNKHLLKTQMDQNKINTGTQVF